MVVRLRGAVASAGQPPANSPTPTFKLELLQFPVGSPLSRFSRSVLGNSPCLNACGSPARQVG
jgi:hypothetical protein